MKKEILVIAVIIVLGIGLANFNSLSAWFFFPTIEKKDFYCYKNSLADTPYWYECNGIKVTQTVPNNLFSIDNFTVFPEEKRVFWEFKDRGKITFYSNSFAGNSQTLLTKPVGENTTIEEFSAGEKRYLDILQESKILVYRIVKKSAEKTVSDRVFSIPLDGGATKELLPEQTETSKVECLNFENSKLFWFFKGTDRTGEKTNALFQNTPDGNGITQASYTAKACNPEKLPKASSKIMPMLECSEDTFYSKGNFVFWKFQDIWNYNDCNANSLEEGVYTTHIPDNDIKLLTQYVKVSRGDYLEIFKEGIDLAGNRFVWIYYSKDLKGKALFYNCLKGAGKAKIIDNSLGNTSKEITITGNTITWQANEQEFSAQLLECPN